MCGIAAIIASGDKSIPFSLLREMDARLAHRGPDGSGLAVFDREAVEIAQQEAASFALLHRRLAIIDLDRRADQPMRSSDGRYTIVLNGEIYNYLELRQELAALGYRFRTESDTEVLLAAFAEWREASLPRLVGMFAFMILDAQRRECFVARDPFGIKPLYWAQASGLMAFASEIPPLLALPGLAMRPNMSSVGRFLASGQTERGTDTMFAGISSFPAGSFATFKLGAPRAPQPERYWRPTIAPTEGDITTNAGRLRDLFLDSLKLHLRSDVPFGCALSGGIDSSAILCGLREVGGDALTLRSFSFIASGSHLDESRYIAVAAGASRAFGETVTISPNEILADIDRLIEVQGEPFATLSIYAQYRVMKLAASHGVKVMLDGQGADELFAGYRPYLARRMSELLRKGDALGALALMREIRQLPGASKLLVAQAFEPAVPPWLRRSFRSLAGKAFLPEWIDERELIRRSGSVEPVSVPRGRHLLHEALVQSLTETVLPALLRFEDRNSMAFAIEARVPFLTPALADFAYSLPSSHLIDGRATSKSVLREALSGIVPDEILGRRDKIGFATPDVLWARELASWLEGVLTSESARQLPWLRANKARNVLQKRMQEKSELGTDLLRTGILVRWMGSFGLTPD